MVYVEVTVPGYEAGAVAKLGAAVAPSKLTPAVPRPADFDQFWDARLKALAEVPIEPMLTPVESPDPSVELFSVVAAQRGLDRTRLAGEAEAARPVSGAGAPAVGRRLQADVEERRRSRRRGLAGAERQLARPAARSGAGPAGAAPLRRCRRALARHVVLPEHVPARRARCRLRRVAPGLGRPDAGAHGHEHGRAAEPGDRGAAPEGHGGAGQRAGRRRLQRRPARPQGRLSELGRRAPADHADGALLRRRQLRAAHHGTGGGDTRLHRHDHAPGRDLDRLQPDEGTEGADPDDRIGPQQPHAGEARRLGGALARGAADARQRRDVRAGTEPALGATP